MGPNRAGSESATGNLSEYIPESQDNTLPESLYPFPPANRKTGHFVPSISLDQVTIDPQTVQLIPIEKAIQYRMLPLNRVGNRLQLAMADPEDLLAVENAALITGMKIEPVAVERHELDAALRYYSQLTMSAALDRNLQTGQRTYTPISVREESVDPDLADDPVVRLVHSFLNQAVVSGASDIHLEPQDTKLRVRMRIDGRLAETALLPLQAAPAIGSCIKVLSGLDISEKRLPQDGRLTSVIDDRRVSFRVSTIPSIHGEKLVLRVLDQSRGLLSLERLGLYGPNRQIFDRLLLRPHGLVLVVGPTGSGKTSTLYAMLQHLNSPERNIITLEDPVEYSLPGITQAQINNRAGFTFVSGLRSLLRSDPDIIMVGEIRDTETARLAVHAALTGHLVLTTLHTTSAAGTVIRLLDMGIEPFLLGAALTGVISQRLVRTLCPDCREAYRLTGTARQVLGLTGEPGHFFYRSTGCHQCRGTGYQGRMAIQEVMEVDSLLRSLITQGVAEKELEAAALDNGMVSLMEDGLDKARRGLTSIEELMRTLSLQP
jgi:type IV pilus assembly protein PilB